MARTSFSINVAGTITNGTLHTDVAKCNGSDALTDDLVLSINLAKIDTRTKLRLALEQLLVRVASSKELTP